MSTPINLEALLLERKLAAFAMIGTVRALLYVSKTLDAPVDRPALQEALDRYEEAETAITQFVSPSKKEVA